MVDQIAVVAKCHVGSIRGHAEHRLGVFPGVATSGGVAGVSDCDITVEGLQDWFVKDLGDQAEILEHEDLFTITDCDTCGLLATVLEGEETEIRKLGHFLTRCPNAKHTAFFTRGLFVLIIVGMVQLRHPYGMIGIYQRTRERVLIKLCHMQNRSP